MQFPTSAVFVGRDSELTEIRRLLSDQACRLLTLVGPGGIGKTRLAIEAVRHMTPAQGVYFVPLQALTSPNYVVNAIGDALGYQFYQGSEPKQQLLDYLRDNDRLLVLDNFEHLLDTAVLLSDILAYASGVRMLVTSRERLNLVEEWVLEVGGLAYPSQESEANLEQYSAVELFVQHARRVKVGFALNNTHKPSVIRICQLVEGMPLGLELAAVWLKTMTCAQIADEIQRNIDFLATPLRNAPERHRSMRTVFNQSWKLLTSEEQVVFRKLVVFRGGFEREAVERVANASLRTLTALVDKSLLHVTPIGRFDIHELLRQYGEEYLEQSGEADTTRDAHSAYFTDFLAQREADLKGHRQREALDEIDADFENVRSAWHWVVKQKNYAAINRSLESLDLFCASRSRWHDRETFFRQAQEQLDLGAGREPHPVWGRILGRGERSEPREHEALRAQREQALAIAQQYGNQTEMAYCLWSLGEGIEQAGDYSGALPFLERSLAYFHEVGDRYYIAKVLNELGLCYWGLGKLDYAIKFSQQSLDLRRAIGGQRGIGWSLYNLGIVSRDAGLYADSMRYLNEARTLWREIDDEFGIAHSSASLALLAFLSGDFEQARIFAQEALDKSTAAIVNRELISVLTLVTLGNIASLDGAYIRGRQLCEQSQPLASPLTMPFVDWGLCIAACGLGDYQTARRYLQVALECAVAVQSIGGMALPLPSAALVLANEGRKEQAVELLALAFNHPASANGWLQIWPLLTRLRTQLEGELGAAAYAAAWERGKSSDLATVAAGLLDHFQPDQSSRAVQASNRALIEPLSQRELEVLQGIAVGLSNAEIAAQLVVQVSTIKKHINRLYGKLGVQNRTQALIRAQEWNLV